MNYYRFETDLPLWLCPAGAAMAYHLFGGYSYEARTAHWLKALPPAFPVLSLRSGDDHLVPMSAIDKFFDRETPASIQKHVIENSAHLAGLRTDPEGYRRIVETFLNSVASKVF